MDILEKIQEEIAVRARSYTPEWRFDRENPDIGSALALVFAQLLARTAGQFTKLPQKNRIAFLNELDACILPAIPSRGYVQFRLINEEAPAVAVEAGTVLIAADDTLQDRETTFETCEEVYVTPAEISDIYRTCGARDTLEMLYDRQNTEWRPFRLFSREYANLQAHEMYISHDILFDISSEATLALTCFAQGRAIPATEWLAAFADEKTARFEYAAGEGWLAFDSIRQEGDKLLLHKTGQQPEFARKTVAGQEHFWIRLRVLDVLPFCAIHLERVELSAWNEAVAPESVFGAQQECEVSRFFPFGESLQLYQEVYFAAGEVLSKKGAQITFSYHIDFQKIPLATQKRQELNWEWIMKQEEMRQPPEYDVTVEGVIWEYYNGAGWKKLFSDNRASRAFSLSGKEEERYRTLRFRCPDDIEKTLVNALETYYIRARIMKIGNLYKLTGHYLVPVLENVSFGYRYSGEKPEPQRYVFYNNLEYQWFEGGRLPADGFLPFPKAETGKRALYLGFSMPPAGSPLKMLVSIAEHGENAAWALLWEYWNGKIWKSLNPVDGTEHFSKTGIVTFSGTTDMREKKLFGKTRWWIRILDSEDAFRGCDTCSGCNTCGGCGEEDGRGPLIRNLYMNTTSVCHRADGGAYGNLPHGKINRTERAIGYINRVENPLAMTGGCDAETPEQAMMRMSGAIRHQGRAVSARDYEQLAMCAVRNLRMVKCFCGYDGNSKPLGGAVTLVVLPEQGARERHGFTALKEQILEYMKDKVSVSLTESGKFFVVLPELIEVCLYLELYVEDFNQVSRVKREIAERLEVFLQPKEKGDTRMGWEIGSFPNTVQIQNAIHDVEGIVRIRKIMMSAYAAGSGGQEEVDVESVKTHRYVLPLNGKHEIIVYAEKRK